MSPRLVKVSRVAPDALPHTVTVGRPAGLTLLVVTSSGSYPLLRYLASRYVRAGRPCAFLYAGPADRRFSTIAADAKALGIDAEALEQYLDDERKHPPLKYLAPKPALLRHLIRYYELATARAHVDIFAAQLSAAAQVLARFKPAAVVVTENGISGPLPFLSLAKARGVTCATIPYGNCRVVDLEIDQERKRRGGDQIIPQGRPKKLLELLLSKWIKTGPHSGAVMFHPEYILAMEAMGLTLEIPWICHGGPMDVMCVENRTGFAQYVGEGLPVKKLKLTGSPYCDEMLDALALDAAAASALHQPRYINPLRPRVLVSWPPDYHATHVGRNEFPSYAEMTGRYMAFFKSLEGCDVTYSLHPDAGETAMGILRENGIEVSKEHLVGLLPRHDIFVTFFSSAIRWAVAAGKPIVNIDLYQQEIQNFVHLAGVVHTRNFAEFSERLQHVVSSPIAFADLARHQIAAAPDYGIMDHKSVARVLSEIDAAVARKA